MAGVPVAIALTATLVLLLVAAIVIIMQAKQTRGLRHQTDDLLLQIDEVRTRARFRERNAVAQSRIVHIGKISEQLAPLLPGFQYNLKDVQWVGGTIDAIVWDGLEEGREVTVVLLDVKTGRGSVTGRQRKIRDAVDAGRVEFKVFQFRPERAADTPMLSDVPAELAYVDEEDLVGEWVVPDDDHPDWGDSIGEDRSVR